MTSSAETQLATQSAYVMSLCSCPSGPDTSLRNRLLPSRDIHLTNTEEQREQDYIHKLLAHILYIPEKLL